jgi:ATP-dependent Clp protease ATP-binding subunit ClpC
VTAAVRARFRPEFLNRIDDVVLFPALDRAQLVRITGLLLAETSGRLGAQGIGLTVTDAARDRLAELGYEPDLGARPLRRTLSRELDRRLSRMIIAGELSPGGHVDVDVADGALTVRVR